MPAFLFLSPFIAKVWRRPGPPQSCERLCRAIPPRPLRPQPRLRLAKSLGVSRHRRPKGYSDLFSSLDRTRSYSKIYAPRRWSPRPAARLGWMPTFLVRTGRGAAFCRDPTAPVACELRRPWAVSSPCVCGVRYNGRWSNIGTGLNRGEGQGRLEVSVCPTLLLNARKTKAMNGAWQWQNAS